MVSEYLFDNCWELYRHKNDHRVEYWVGDATVNNGTEVEIRATQNALHPEWDEVPLKFTVDGGTMPYDVFMELYEQVPEPTGLKWGTTTGLEL